MFSKDLAPEIGSSRQDDKDVMTPCQLLTLLLLLVIVIGAARYDTLFQLGEPYHEVFEFVFNVFASLGCKDQRDCGRLDGDALRSI
jgi:hypothetical protein